MISIKEEPFIGFDKIIEDFDRIFNDELNDLELSGSYIGVSSDNVKDEVDIIMYASYSSNIKLNKNAQKRKTKRNAKPASLKGINISIRIPIILQMVTTLLGPQFPYP